MKIYCKSGSLDYMPTYDKRLDQFLGTNVWIRMEFPYQDDYGHVPDHYMNLIARDGDSITYRIFVIRDYYENLCPYNLDDEDKAYIRNSVLKAYKEHTQLYSNLRFVPVEPFDLITTEEILDIVGET